MISLTPGTDDSSATVTPLPPPPRPLRVRWRGMFGPNFSYFVHVALLAPIPMVLLLWTLVAFAWVVAGTNVGGTFVYRLNIIGGMPQDSMTIEYGVGNNRHIIPYPLAPAALRQSGMPDTMTVVPGKPLFTMPVTVRILRMPGYPMAVPVFPLTWVWKRVLGALAAFLIFSAGLFILHGELFQTIYAAILLVRRGEAIPGRILTTHETGWWETSTNYSRTYIRRVYADYEFKDHSGKKRRGCQLVLGAVDPARLPAGFEVTVLYDLRDPGRHLVYELSPLRTRER